jgi:hypothetical protein
MSLTISAARRIQRANSLVELQDEAERLLERVKAAKRGKTQRRNSREPRAIGRMKATKEAEDAREKEGKAAAMKRAEDPPGKPRCEFYEDGKRCFETATDAHHCLGGVHKEEMEALPNGEGFQAGCRNHHEIIGHSSSRLVAVSQAKEHAVRIGSKGLLRHVEAALALYEGKHPKEATQP